MKFNDALTENKKRRNSKGKAKTERKWKTNEETGSSLRELKTRRLALTDKF